ncbi:hypothetical protein KR018_008097 [Drosophila ironensis]|nr:hypothetical protein KR018_008097 [Drosophila ironensis]
MQKTYELMLMVAVLPIICRANNTEDGMLSYRASPKLAGPIKLLHEDEDAILNSLDGALEKISTIYMQALFAGTHTPELEAPLRALEMELFDLLDQLYKQNRLKDYMKFEAEVTRQMIIYNMLKRLFGYTQDSVEVSPGTL